MSGISERWRVAGLAVVVAVSAFAVPSLVVRGDASARNGASGTGGTVAAAAPTPGTAVPTTATEPTTTTPTTTPSTTPTTTPTRTRGPRPRASTTKAGSATSPPVFAKRVIDAAARDNQGVGIRVITCLTCLSGSRVQYLGQGHVLIVPVKDVPVAGERTLTIAYTCACSDEPRVLDLRVNDDEDQSLPLKGAGSWDVPARVKVRIRLERGDNKILFYNANDPAPDLDRFTIT